MDDEPAETEKKSVKVSPDLRNHIDLQTTGVSVREAFLFTPDGNRLPDDNRVTFDGTPVKLQLYIDDGWVEKNGSCQLGASERIVADDGSEILDEKDLFSKYTNGITASDAKKIQLSAAIQQKEGAEPFTVTVYFRVWDKQGTGAINGSFQLHSK